MRLPISALSLLVATVAAQCRTNENPYCAGNDDFEAICCTYPNVCYWADRQGTPACCPAGQWCLNSDGQQVIPEAQHTVVAPAPAPAPAPEPEPTTIYTSRPPQTTPTRTITQEPQPTQQTIITTYQQPEQSTIIVTTEEGPGQGPVEGIGSTVIATASSIINVFEGAAPTARPSRCAVPVAGALAVAAWHMI